MTNSFDKGLELGKKSEYESQYNPNKLFPISRAKKRMEIGVDPEHPHFYGFDLWNHYEVSWLNPKGKPIVATAEIIYDSNTPCIVESKSLKLYFNTFNNTHFESIAEVEQIICRDISRNVQGTAGVKVRRLGETKPIPVQNSFAGSSIDDLDISCSIYTVDPSFLVTSSEEVEETLYSDLLKSNCLVTFQPDWGSVLIEYKGPKIDRAGLLRYIVSFRNHNEFHEQCIERIFTDILNHCHPKELTVYGRFTRRGGVDINPYRTTNKEQLAVDAIRLLRQ